MKLQNIHFMGQFFMNILKYQTISFIVVPNVSYFLKKKHLHG
jgi:hypothetical protein